jgi:hypothetical protein
MIESIGAYLAGVVGLVAGLVAFVKSMVLARETRSLAVDLKLLSSELDTKTELLRFNLRNQELIVAKQYAKEFEAYENIWESVERIYVSAGQIAQFNELDIDDSKAIQNTADESLSKPWSEFEAVMRKYAPFIHEDAYDALNEFGRIFKEIWSVNKFGKSLFSERPTSAELSAARDACMAAIRKRVGLSKHDG